MINREIRFRGKVKNENQWIYGYYFFKYRTQQHVIHCDEKEGILVDCEYEINPKTLGQLTGLKDKNGKNIYEGDIVKVSGQSEVPYDDRKDFEIITYNHTGTVVFDSGCFVFKNHLTREQLIEHIKYFPESDSDIICDFNSFLSVEIIGNIYDTPELIDK